MSGQKYIIAGQSHYFLKEWRIETAEVPATTEESRLAKMISILEEREARRKAVTFRRSRWALCKTKVYEDCREDKVSCESGYSCLSADDDGRCCISMTANVLLPSNPTACPSPPEMGYTCSYGGKRTVTSWCRSNSDCMAGSVHLCCDTGVRSIENDRCPPASLLSVKCRMHSSRSTNWCNSDQDCQLLTNSKVPQSCCPTPCGYNACVANTGYQLAFG
ncbi:unnamed protein product [Haemonchus placei]|uniref:WAP domain-containing protein n=1 Tax=Haemonchus placei TaxID=6290 RepID=A0A158QK27_HAEPC|nr:unnamed protein product [Haemonchus placei]